MNGSSQNEGGFQNDTGKSFECLAIMLRRPSNSKNNANDVLDALEEEFDTGLDDDIIGCISNSTSELGFAIEQLEVIFNRTLEAFHKLDE